MLSIDEVKHIALLARIGLKDEEVPTYQKDLSAVLDFFHELEEAKTETIEPIRHITGTQDVMRQDSMDDFGTLGKENIIKNMPDTKDNFLKVRSVF